MSKLILAKTAKLGYFNQVPSGSPVTGWGKVGLVNSVYNTVLKNSKSITPNPAVVVENIDTTSSDGLLNEQNRVFVDNLSGLKEIPFSGYAYKEQLAFELASVTQGFTQYSTYICDTNGGDEITITSISVAGLYIGQTIEIDGATFFGGTKTTTTITNIDGFTVSIADACDDTLTDAELTVLDYSKEFIYNNSVIDFAANEGRLTTVAFQTYNGSSAGDGVKLDNAVLDSYTISINNQGSGTDKLMKTEGVWKGNTLTTDLDFSGTWVAPTSDPTYYKNFKLNLTIDGTNYENICWKNFQIKFERGLDTMCRTNGVATNYISVPKITATIDIPYTGSNYAFYSKYVEGVNVGFKIYNEENPNSWYHVLDGNLAIEVESAILTANPYQYDGEYLSLRLEMEILKPSGTMKPIFFMGDSRGLV